MIQSGSRTASAERTAAHIARIREVLERAETFGVPTLVSQASVALGGILRHIAPEEARVHLEQAVELAVAVDAERPISAARFQLAALHTEMHRPIDALTVLEPTLQHHLRCGARRWLLSSAAYCIRPLLETDHAELAAVILGAVVGELDAHPHTRRATVYVDRESLLRDLSTCLGDRATENLMDDGRGRSLEGVARQVVHAIRELSR
jgi:hypothetical protein